MKLFLSEFTAFPAKKEIIGRPDTFSFDSESIVGLSSIAMKLNIQQSGEEYFCQGHLIAKVKVECARCLNNFDLEINNPVDFIICDEEHHKKTTEEGIDDEDYVFFTPPRRADRDADLTKIARQAVLLEVDMIPLCKKDCQGLCQNCGANLNISPCECSPENIDPRWEALKNLTDK